jgi:hypothetical protein
VLFAAVVGAVVGACRIPHGRHLAPPVVVLPGVAVAGALMHLLAGRLGSPADSTAFAASLALLCGFALVNRHFVGMGVLATGLLLNLAAVVVHHGMPVRAAALVEAGAVSAEDLADADLGAGRRFERTDDALPVIGDVIPVTPLGAAMSFGDLIAMMGTATIAGDLARYARRGSTWSLATTAARLVQDWGEAPSPSPVSGSQYSDQPDSRAPDTSPAASDEAAAAEPAAVAASHDR